MKKYKVLAPFTIPVLVVGQPPSKRVTEISEVIDSDKFTQTQIADLTERGFIKEYDPDAKKTAKEMSEVEIGEELEKKGISIDGIKNRKTLEKKYEDSIKVASK